MSSPAPSVGPLAVELDLTLPPVGWKPWESFRLSLALLIYEPEPTLILQRLRKGNGRSWHKGLVPRVTQKALPGWRAHSPHHPTPGPPQRAELKEDELDVWRTSSWPRTDSSSDSRSRAMPHQPPSAHSGDRPPLAAGLLLTVPVGLAKGGCPQVT